MAITRAQVSLELIADAGKAINGLRQVGAGIQHMNFALEQATNGQYRFSQSTNRWVDSSGNIVSAATAVSAAVNNLERETKEYGLAMEAVTAGLDRHQLKLLKTAGVINQTAHANGSASFAAISLGQTFQDMGQFGMGAAQGVRAITNNVQMLFMSMTMLKEQIGPDKNVFAALGSALKGPVGALALFSLATAGIEFFTNRMMMAKKEAKELGNALKGVFSGISPIVGQASLSTEELERRQDILRFNLNKTKSTLSAVKQEQHKLNAAIASNIPPSEATVKSLQEQREKLEHLEDKYESYLDTIVEVTDETRKENEALVDSLELFGDLGIEMSGVANLKNELLKETFNLRIESAKLTAMNDEETLSIKRKNDALRQEISLKNLWNSGAGFDDPKTLDLFTTLGGSTKADPEKFFNDLKDGLDMGVELLREESVRIEEAYLDLFPSLPDLDIDLGEYEAYNQEFADMSLKGFDGIFDGVDPAVIRSSLLDTLTEMKLGGDAVNEQVRQFISEYEKNVSKEEALKQRRMEVYASTGSELISAGIGIAVGGQSFNDAMMGFLETWGKSLIKTGLLAMSFGGLLEKLKLSIKTPGGGFLAIAAGAALVAVAKRLTRSTEQSAGMGGKQGAGSNLTGLDQWFTNGMTLDTIQSMQSSTLAPSTLTGIGVGATPSVSDRTSMRVELVSSGRNLVSVIANENSASSRRIGAGGVSGGGVGAGQASLQMGSGWDSGFLAKDRSR